MSRDVGVGPIRIVREGGTWQVEADVDGTPIWFASSDAVLDPNPEALAGAVLLAAARRGRHVFVRTDAVSAEWRDNVVEMMGVWREWWGYPVLPPKVTSLRLSSVASDGAVLCFTGGVDSFYSLLCADAVPNALVFVQGYDIPLDDRGRMAAWDVGFRQVAAAGGLRAIGLRSNLRDHPLIARSQWDRAHGGALAAAGHLLASTAGTLVIASSFPVHYNYTWGSHARVDRLWASDRLRVAHHGAALSRNDKLLAIADDPLVHAHLRVCWENRSATGNCSRCDKCVCTMASIAACGDPHRFLTFDWSTPLEDRIHALRSTRFVRTYGELLQRDLPRPVSAAIRALLRRSAVHARLRSLWQWWRG